VVAAPAAVPIADLTGELRRLFGFAGFLPGQEEIVRRALAGRDTLALMPTGSGKSLPYQLAAMLRPSPTLVVSPLIALMKDQLDKLPPEVAARTTVVNSSLEPEEAAARVQAFADGRFTLLYAAPERLRQERFVAALRDAGVGLVVVDEVHCVTMWGHDFRPDYLFIRAALDQLGEPPVLGLTATATPETEREIGGSLGRRFEAVRASVVRPNLRHAVDVAEGEEDRHRRLLARMAASDGPTIVYARARKKCEELARFLKGHRVDALAYHAGLPTDVRTQTQEAFLEGRARVIVATTAFGMGIDKPDIRLVLLYNFPKSLEDYVQMVGRAGRDGRASDCVLLAGKRDGAEVRRFARGDVPSPATLRVVYRVLRDAAIHGTAVVGADDLAAGAQLDENQDPRVLVGMLEQAGLVRRGFDVGRAMSVDLLEPPADAAERIARLLERYDVQATARADRIVAFAESRQCRQIEIADHFGEELGHACGDCDRCLPVAAAETTAAPAIELPEDIAGTILDTVARLRWPLGRRGLMLMLTGSISAPPSARRSPGYGALAAARPGQIGRWIDRLVESGHLEAYESEDGFRLLRLRRRDDPPLLIGAPTSPDTVAAADSPLFERLRAWRYERARSDDVPAFVVFPDRTLRALAAGRPQTREELAAVDGVGPAKLERYGLEILGLLRS
jgi:ATP-dependent DNA helicase RecQ